MSSPENSRPERFDLAVVALSARALAASARRAGLSALAIDLFADADTREHAALAVRAPSNRRGPGFDRRGLLETLAAHAPEGLLVVLGAGFEHAPGLMRAVARRNPIVGATPETVALLKDPRRFADLLAELDVPHPPIIEDATAAALHLSPAGREPAPDLIGAPPTDLSKRVGASGGAHIREAGAAASSPRRYRQAFVSGRAVSALFLANGREARIVGFSGQWTDPGARSPFRYGGAVGPIALPPSPLGGGVGGGGGSGGGAEPDAALRRPAPPYPEPPPPSPSPQGGGCGDVASGSRTPAADIAAALQRIVAATGLVGLASADMILPPEGGFVLLEINPRPGATLDVFDHAPLPSLLALHLDAAAGRLPAALPVPASARAAAIVYADRPTSVAALRRPIWTADWPSCDETLPDGAPICTVVAAGPTASAARALVEERRSALLNALRAAPAAALNHNKTEEAPA